MHREVVEADVAQKLHAAPRFLENVCRDLLLERGELDGLQPPEQPIDGKVAHAGDRVPGNLHVQRLRLELGAVTIWALLRDLILSQKHADVLLVFLLLEIDEERKDALVAFRLSVEQQLARRRRELVPRHVHANAFALRELGEREGIRMDVPWNKLSA